MGLFVASESCQRLRSTKSRRRQPHDLQAAQDLVPLPEQVRVGAVERVQRVDRRRDVVLRTASALTGAPRSARRAPPPADRAGRARCPPRAAAAASSGRSLELLARAIVERALRVAGERLGLGDQRLGEVGVGVHAEPAESCPSPPRASEPPCRPVAAPDREPAEQQVDERHRLPLAACRSTPGARAADAPRPRRSGPGRTGSRRRCSRCEPRRPACRRVRRSPATAGRARSRRPSGHRSRRTCPRLLSTIDSCSGSPSCS